MIKAPPATKWNFLSLGAGVQSSTLALMAAKGEVTPMPDAAIFADTQAEPNEVYEWLEYLEKSLPFPVYRVTAGNLEKTALKMRVTKDGRKFSKTDIPVFTKNDDGGFGMVPSRSCTVDYKIRPITKEVKGLASIKRGQKEITVTQWIGISWDEIQRMKASRDPWQQNRFPLIEKQLTRQGCKQWMKANGYQEPPRSSCVFCPFHSDNEWRRLKTKDAQSFRRAVQFEKALQKIKASTQNFKTTPYLHASRTPLDEVDFSTDIDRGQQTWDFSAECEGMCGV